MKHLLCKHEPLNLIPRAHMTCCMLAIPALGMWSQEDPWGPLPSQPSLLGEFQLQTRYPISKPKLQSDWRKHPRLTSGLHVHMFSLHTCMYMPHTVSTRHMTMCTHTRFSCMYMAVWLHGMLEPGHESRPLCCKQISASSWVLVKITLKVQIKCPNSVLPVLLRWRHQVFSFCGYLFQSQPHMCLIHAALRHSLYQQGSVYFQTLTFKTKNFQGFF